MNHFGPVGEAAHGGHSNPAFDLIAGFAVLALTWGSYFRKEERPKDVVWAAVGISVICGVFIGVGLYELLR